MAFIRFSRPVLSVYILFSYSFCILVQNRVYILEYARREWIWLVAEMVVARDWPALLPRHPRVWGEVDLAVP